jgi:hypothetical protein
MLHGKMGYTGFDGSNAPPLPSDHWPDRLHY